MTESNAVFQGFWINRLTSPNQWLLTLGDGWAVLFQLALGIYILYAGDRSWVFLRRKIVGIHLYGLDRMIKPKQHGHKKGEVNDEAELEERTSPKVPGDSVPQSEQYACGNMLEIGFSRMEAICAFLGVHGTCPNKSNETRVCRICILRSDFPATKRNHLAFWAIVVCVFSVLIAPLFPWLASNGGEKNPLVVSKWTPPCDAKQVLDSVRQWKVQEAERRYLSHEMPVPKVVDTDAKCPFEQEVCVNRSQEEHDVKQDRPALRLERWIRPQDIGYNSRSRVSLHHALSCSPINLDRFTVPSDDNQTECSGWLNFARSEIRNVDVLLGYVTQLCSANGPNKYSSEYSGWGGYRLGQNHSMTMNVVSLPRPPPVNRSDTQNISPHLYRHDGTAFITAFYARSTTFEWHEPIDDPIFKAHRQYPGSDREYLPDHEVTALACVEQYRFCASGEECSQWFGNVPDDFALYTHGSAPILSRHRQSVYSKYDTFPNDLFRAYNMIFTHGSVAHYLDLNPKFIMAERNRFGRRVQLMHGSKDAWKAEVRAWFDSAYLLGYSHLFHSIVRHPSQISLDRLGLERDVDRVYCSSLMFRDKDYTTFNVFALMGFLVPISVPVAWNLWRKRFHVGTICVLIWKCSAMLRMAGRTLSAVILGTAKRVPGRPPLPERLPAAS